MTGIAWRTLRTPVGGSRAIRTLGRGPSESPRSTSTACKIGPVDALTELGILLRRWRERVTPADVGLPAGTGRRVRGLRRQEVAQLSGVSADYLVQLEQGRATSPSTQVLAALARALRLSNFERDHLLRLGGYTPPAEHAPTLSAAVRRLVDQLDSTPAAIYDLCWNPLAWNPMWAAVNGDPLSRPARARNMMWSFMTGQPSRIKRRPGDDRTQLCGIPASAFVGLRAVRPPFGYPDQAALDLEDPPGDVAGFVAAEPHH